MTEAQMIEFWKSNTQGFMFAPKEAQEWLMNCRTSVDVLVEVSPSKCEWRDNGGSCGGNPVRIYRLPVDYRPEKRGRLVECEVVGASGFYQFRHPTAGVLSLIYAPGMVGFDSIEYGTAGRSNYLKSITGDDGKPTAPTKVRFWVGE